MNIVGTIGWKARPVKHAACVERGTIPSFPALPFLCRLAPSPPYPSMQKPEGVYSGRTGVSGVYSGRTGYSGVADVVHPLPWAPCHAVMIWQNLACLKLSPSNSWGKERYINGESRPVN